MIKNLIYLIPALLFVSISVVGCIQTQHHHKLDVRMMMPEKPAKPVLKTMENPSDPKGICLDEENTRQLMEYIYQLEKGYD